MLGCHAIEGGGLGALSHVVARLACRSAADMLSCMPEHSGGWGGWVLCRTSWRYCCSWWQIRVVRSVPEFWAARDSALVAGEEGRYCSKRGCRVECEAYTPGIGRHDSHWGSPGMSSWVQGESGFCKV